MSNADVPIWEKYTLTIDEAAKYFRIGENKLRKLAEENPAAGWVIMNGNRIQIKRKQFEKMIDTIPASGNRKRLHCHDQKAARPAWVWASKCQNRTEKV